MRDSYSLPNIQAAPVFPTVLAASFQQQYLLVIKFYYSTRLRHLPAIHYTHAH
jgi:hypothetical protein